MDGEYTVFKTFNNYYVYDANIDKIKQISKELFNELDKKVIHKNSLELKQLMNSGFFKKNTVNLLNRSETDFLKNFYERKIGNVIFQVTQNCNLRCLYCPYSQSNKFNRSHSSLKMSKEVGFKILDFVFEHSVDRNNISIGFYGGEPLLNFSLIKELVEYANKIFCGKQIIYSVTTNLTTLSTQILDFFEENNFDMMVSLDGIKNSNDKNRKFYRNDKSTFDVVINNLKNIYDNYPNLKSKCSISMVMDPSYKLEEYELLNVEYPFMKDFKYNAVIQEDLFSDNPNRWDEMFKSQYYYKIFLCYMREIKKYLFKDDLFLFDNSSEVLEENLNSLNSFDLSNCVENAYIMTSGMCSIGKNKLFVNANGDFYPCEKVGESNSEFVIGNVNKGFDLNQCKKLLNFTQTFSNRCLNCIAKRDCQMCIKEFSVSGVFDESSLEICKKYREVFKSHLIAKATLYEAYAIGGYHE